MLEQLFLGLSPQKYAEIFPALLRAMQQTVGRAIVRATNALVRSEVVIPEWDAWVHQCMSGAGLGDDFGKTLHAVNMAKDRTVFSGVAEYAMRAAWLTKDAMEKKRVIPFSDVSANSELAAIDDAWLCGASDRRARDFEQTQQADDIRAEIPEWPGE